MVQVSSEFYQNDHGTRILGVDQNGGITVVVPRHAVPQPVRHGEDPLA